MSEIENETNQTYLRNLIRGLERRRDEYLDLADDARSIIKEAEERLSELQSGPD